MKTQVKGIVKEIIDNSLIRLFDNEEVLMKKVILNIDKHSSVLLAFYHDEVHLLDTIKKGDTILVFTEKQCNKSTYQQEVFEHSYICRDLLKL